MKYLLTFIMTLAALMLSTTSFAESSAFDAAKFDAQLKAEKSILVVVHAPWCSTCRAQAPVIKEVLENKAFAEIAVMHVDFDSQKDALKKLGVKRQSTLIVFKKGQEVGRSLGDTTAFGIESLLQKAL